MNLTLYVSRMASSGLYMLVFLLCSSNLAASMVYHITPTSADLCTLPCLTLSRFATNSSYYLSFNTTLVLLPGRHNLSMKLEIADLNSFYMTSVNATAQVECENDSSFSFSNCQHIHITNVEFIGCGRNQFKNVNEVVLQGTRFVGREDSGTALELTETVAQITSSVFMSNMNGTLRNLGKQLELVRTILRNQDVEFNTNGTWVGGALVAVSSNISIVSSVFINNRAEVGGALFVENSCVTIDSTTFIENQVGERPPVMHPQLYIAGVLYQRGSHTIITNSHFGQNSAPVGGSIFTLRGTFSAYNSSFSSNLAIYGGVLFSTFTDVMIQCQFDHNSASFGGALRSYGSTLTIEGSQFETNNASFGGVVLSFNSSITINESEFKNNNAVVAGAVMVAAGTTTSYYGSLLVTNNSAAEFGIIYLSECSGHFQGNATFSNNYGSFLAIYSDITFSGYVTFMNNIQPHTTIVNFQDGGAVSLFQSNAIFDGICRFEHNQAENGGAVHSIESKLDVNGDVTLAYNTATGNGGGIYLSQSELNCEQRSILHLLGNTAAQRGGGIHAISSTVKSTTTAETNMRFTNNSAERGGGLYLETNAKLYIHKLNPIRSADKAVHFIENSAAYGGAIYVDDSTNSATCMNKSTECFFRVVYNSYISVAPNIATIFFAQNYASVSGSTLFGGLLDRCIVSLFAKLNIYAINAYKRIVSGVTYFKDVSSKINSSSISSYPTQVCLCINNRPNCSHQQLKPIEVKKGQVFSVSLVAVDQDGHPVDATIQSILNFDGSGLAEGQLTRTIPGECAELTFNIVSRQEYEILSLHASNGPCNDAHLSTLTLDINFLPCKCPIGFQPSERNAEINCTCECHHSISEYMTCDPVTETLMRSSQSNVDLIHQ